jgi:hypothetical protein
MPAAATGFNKHAKPDWLGDFCLRSELDLLVAKSKRNEKLRRGRAPLSVADLGVVHDQIAKVVPPIIPPVLRLMWRATLGGRYRHDNRNPSSRRIKRNLIDYFKLEGEAKRLADALKRGCRVVPSSR